MLSHITHPDGTQIKYTPGAVKQIHSGGVACSVMRTQKDGTQTWVTCLVPRGRLSEAIHRND